MQGTGNLAAEVANACGHMDVHVQMKMLLGSRAPPMGSPGQLRQQQPLSPVWIRYSIARHLLLSLMFY